MTKIDNFHFKIYKQFIHALNKTLILNLIPVIGLRVLNGDIILGVLRLLLKVNGLELTG
jgi:hypothetical protein